MRAGRRTGVFGVLAFALGAVLFAAPAGAEPGVGQVTVSNPTPTRASTIEVDSTGWRPGSVVSVTIDGVPGILGRATADANGSVHVRASIPAYAPPGFNVLSVNGSTPAGVPQQIVTAVSVAKPAGAPAPEAPWVTVCLLMAVATLFLLASVRSVNSDHQLSVMQPS